MFSECNIFEALNLYGDYCGLRIVTAGTGVTETDPFESEGAT